MNGLKWGSAAGLLLAGLLLVPSASSREADEPPDIGAVKLPNSAELNAAPDQIAAAMARAAVEDWKPKVSPEKGRGAAELYGKLGPAIVVVRSDTGHGTGSIIDPAGWVVTNHHVVENASFDAATGTRRVKISMGKLVGDQMTLLDEEATGEVYKTDTVRDLALIKITKLPKGVEKLSVIDLAGGTPKVADKVVSIGHPGAGILWTVRTGEVSGIGDAPRAFTRPAVAILRLKDEDEAKLRDALRAFPVTHKVLLSTCGCGPGDSGGPLVNMDGKLVAVTYAVPPDDARGSTNLVYHVHLDDVKKFLADKPTKAEYAKPSPWPPAFYSSLADLDGDGRTETALFGMTAGGAPTGFLVDLKGATDKDFKKADLGSFLKREGFKFHFGYQPARAGNGGIERAFYDTDGDGTLDLMTASRPGKSGATVVWRLQGNVWKADIGDGSPLMSAKWFKSDEMKTAMGKWLTALLKK